MPAWRLPCYLLLHKAFANVWEPLAWSLSFLSLAMSIEAAEQNILEFNTFKTVEMVVDFRKSPAPAITICDSMVNVVESHRFPGTIVSKDLKWELNIGSLTKKTQQRMYYLQQLKKFNLPKIMVYFYTAVIKSILRYTARNKGRLQRIIGSTENVNSCNLLSLQDSEASRKHCG